MYIEPRLNDHSDIWSANLKGRIIHCFGEIEENRSAILCGAIKKDVSQI